ncbi:MAG: hypothetical protein WCD18_17380 [Thermosynechococcaceae cyanobacterium]
MVKILRKYHRKYHRFIAIAACLPLLLTVVTGLAFTVIGEWLGQGELADQVLKIHTLEIIGLEKFFPLLNGLSLIGLLVTGIYMTGMFRKHSTSSSSKI